MATITTDRSIQLNAFEETKTGVKGLVDSGITEVPAIFRAPTVVLDNLKPPPASQLTIPTVDLKGGRVFLKKQEGSVTRRGVVVKIGDAAEKWGFFQVVNHGIPLDKMEKMREGIRGFHEQDTESKKRFYLAITPENGFTTATSISTPLGLRAGEIPSVATWPPILQHWTTCLRFVALSSATRLMGIKTDYNLAEDCVDAIADYVKGILPEDNVAPGSYYEVQKLVAGLGLSKHTDFSFLTIVLQGNIGRLQVLHDHYWVDVPPVPGAFVVNIGDLLQLISNDKFISVEHRVVANGAAEPRISVPCFFSSIMKANPREYGPIKELLSEQNPPNYRELTISEFSNMYGTKELNTSALHHFKI
ncbi:unnamed protein product [Brassica rapa subsp. trilocularis]